MPNFSQTLPVIAMNIEKSLDKFFYLTGDEKSDVGNADCISDNIDWDFFINENEQLELSDPIEFKINPGKFEGKIGDFQFNNCGFFLVSDKLRSIIEKHLTEIDSPKWFPATVTDLNGKSTDYSILHLFSKVDFLDHQNSTFVTGTDHPIKKRFDLDKIEDRQIFNSTQHGKSLCVHDVVRKEIEESGCTGMYFYKIHTAGR